MNALRIQTIVLQMLPVTIKSEHLNAFVKAAFKAMEHIVVSYIIIL